jgi:hypothetical protein
VSVTRVGAAADGQELALRVHGAGPILEALLAAGATLDAGGGGA